MMQNNKITRFVHFRNRIARDGAIAFARVLRHHCSLKVLDLSFNRIQSEGAMAIADALREDNYRLEV